MAENLKNVILNYIQEINHFIQTNKLDFTKISFISHSLGGIITRATLPLIENLKDKMHLFLSLNSPHLGFIKNSHAHINLGMWFMKLYKKNISLK